MATSLVGSSILEMSDGDGTDQRANSRMMTLKGGTIVYQNGSCTMTCTILDISDYGAKLKPMDAVHLPDSFRLMITHGPTYECQVVRRSRDQIGVRFL